MRTQRRDQNEGRCCASRLSFWLPLLLLAPIVLLFLFPLLAADEDTARLGGDIPFFHYPWRYFAKESLLSGQIPLWKPYSFGGSPYLSSFEAELFYPDFLLWLPLPLKIAFVWNHVIHFYLGAAGMYVLVHRYTRSGPASLLAALSFMFGAFFVHRVPAGHLQVLQAGVWLPWILLCTEKALDSPRLSSWSLIAGSLLALDILTGFPEISFMIGLTLGLRFAWEVFSRKHVPPRARLVAPAANFAVILVSAVGLAAVQLLPALELIQLSGRVNSSYEVIRASSFSLINIATLLAPEVLGSAVRSNAVQGALIIESACYTGIVALFFAAFAAYLKPHRLAAFYGLLVILSLFLATGAYNPVYPLVSALPGFKQVAAPYRYVFLLAFAVPVLAGLTLHALTRAEVVSDPKRVRRLAAWTLAVAAGVGLVTLLFFWCREPILVLAQKTILIRYSEPQRQLQKLPDLYATQLTGLIALGTLSLLTGALLVYRLRAPLCPGVFSGLAIALLALDLCFFNHKHIRVVATLHGEPVEPYHAFLAGDTGLYRILPLGEANQYPESGLISRISSVLGYDSITLSDYRTYLAALGGVPIEELDARAPLLTRYRAPLADRLNVKYVISPQALHDPDLVLVRDGAYKIYRRRRFAPRAYVVHRVETVPDRQKALTRLQQTPYDAGALVENDFRFPIRPLKPGVSEPVPLVVRDGPNRLTIRADLAAEGFLVISEVYFPGWKAFVDGRRAPLLRTDYLFQGVPLPKGRHTVELIYAPLSLKAGAAISAMTALAMLFLGLSGAIKRQRGDPDGRG